MELITFQRNLFFIIVIFFFFPLWSWEVKSLKINTGDDHEVKGKVPLAQLQQHNHGAFGRDSLCSL